MLIITLSYILICLIIETAKLFRYNEIVKNIPLADLKLSVGLIARRLILSPLIVPLEFLSRF